MHRDFRRELVDALRTTPPPRPRLVASAPPDRLPDPDHLCRLLRKLILEERLTFRQRLVRAGIYWRLVDELDELLRILQRDRAEAGVPLDELLVAEASIRRELWRVRIVGMGAILCRHGRGMAVISVERLSVFGGAHA